MSAKTAAKKRRRRCALCGGIGKIGASVSDGLHCHEITIRCPHYTVAKPGIADLERLLGRKALECLYEFEKI